MLNLIRQVMLQTQSTVASDPGYEEVEDAHITMPQLQHSLAVICLLKAFMLSGKCNLPTCLGALIRIWKRRRYGFDPHSGFGPHPQLRSRISGTRTGSDGGRTGSGNKHKVSRKELMCTGGLKPGSRQQFIIFNSIINSAQGGRRASFVCVV